MFNMTKDNKINKVKVAPSILSANFANLGKEVEDITEAGADYIHIDVMDGHFVPNITIGPDVVKSLRSYTHLPFDVHLMIEPPEPYIEAFVDAGADIITIHAEATTHLNSLISQIKSLGVKAGVSIVPSTPPDVLDYVLSELDLVLIMSVNPGFGGQSFIGNSIDKIRELRYMIDETGKEIELEVDGGINADTAEFCREAGASILVSGSAIFTGNQKDYKQNINIIRQGNIVELKKRH